MERVNLGHIKISFSIVFVMLLLVGTVSAMEWDNVKSYDSKTKTITIINALGLGGDLAKYKLDYNTDKCLINCEARGTAYLYDKGQLFSDLKFYNTKNELDNIKDYKFYIEVNENYKEKEVDTEKEVCKYDIKNKTENCHNEYTYREVIKVKKVWEEYKGEELQGEITWKLKGTKDKKQNIDWIGESFGKKFNEWAWWNSSWSNKKQINITGGDSELTNFTVFIPVANESAMQGDYDDIRFLNSAEDTEFEYDLDYSNTSEAGFWVRIPTLNAGEDNTTIYMYYGDASASSTKDATATYGGGGMGIWHLEDQSDALGVEDLSVLDAPTSENIGCVFGKCYSFDGTNDGFNGSKTTNLGDNNFTIEFWFNTTDTTTSALFGKGSAYYDSGSFLEGIDGGNIWQRIVDDSGNTFYHSATAIGDGKWHQLVLTRRRNPERISLHLDGVLISSSTALIDGFTPIGSVIKFAYWNDGDNDGGSNTQFLDGFLDNVVVFYTHSSDDYIKRSYENANFSKVVFGAEESDTSLNILSMDVDLTYPSNSLVSNNQTQFFNSTLTVTNGNSTNATLYIWNTTSGVYNQSLISGLSGNYTINNWTVNNIAHGNYTWNVYGCADNSTNSLCAFDSANRTFFIDINEPLFNFTQPIINDILLYNDYYNLTFNWSYYDEHPLTTCWYYYDNIVGTQHIVNCDGLNTTINNTFIGEHHIYFYGNDTANNIGNINKTINIFKVGIVYDTSVYETEVSTFHLNITNSYTGKQYYGKLYYNGSEYEPSRNVTDNLTILEYNLAAPSVYIVTNHSFFWQPEINLGGTFSTMTNQFSGGTTNYLNTSYYNQTVNPFIFGTNCTSPYVQGFVLFIKNEDEYDELITSTINANFNVWLNNPDASEKFEFNQTGRSNLTICIENGTQFYIDGEIQYHALSSYPIREFYILNQTINGSITYNQATAYLLNVTYAQATSVYLADSADSPQQDRYIWVYKKNFDWGNYTLMTMGKTDDDGRDILALQNLDKYYRFIFTDYLTTVYSGNDQKVPSCSSTETNCIEFRISENTLMDYYNYMDDIEIEYSYDNSTQTFTFSWNDPNEHLNNICLVTKKNEWKNWTIENEQCSSAYSGTLTYTLAEHDKDYYIYAIMDGSPNQMLFSYYRDVLGGKLADLIGDSGLFLSMIIVMLFAGLALWNPPIAIIAAGFGVIVSVAVGLTALSYGTIISLLIALGVAAWRADRK